MRTAPPGQLTMETAASASDAQQLFARGRTRAQIRAEGRERAVEQAAGPGLSRRRRGDGRTSRFAALAATPATLLILVGRLRGRLPRQVRHRRRLHRADRAGPGADALPPADPGRAAGRQPQLAARPPDRLRHRPHQRPPRLPRLRRLLARRRPGPGDRPWPAPRIFSWDAWPVYLLALGAQFGLRLRRRGGARPADRRHLAGERSCG